MLKRDELADPNSCLNKAQDDEMLFVLLGRDPAAAFAIQAWIGERPRIERNRPEDAQIRNAEECIEALQRAHS